jgi:hypothetical protein
MGVGLFNGWRTAVGRYGMRNRRAVL